jgi:hypothetical protein
MRLGVGRSWLIGTRARAGRFHRRKGQPRLRTKTRTWCLGRSPIPRRWRGMPYPIRSGTGESRVGFGMGESCRQKSAQTRDVGSFQSRRRHVRGQAVRLSVQMGKVIDRPSPFPFSVIPRQPQRPTITNPEAIDFESMRRPRSESQATGLHRWVKGSGNLRKHPPGRCFSGSAKTPSWTIVQDQT